MLTCRVGRILRYLQVFAPHHAPDNHETANGKDQNKRNFLPPGNLQLVQHSHRKNVYNGILEYVEPGVSKENRVDVEARSIKILSPKLCE